MKKHLTNSMKLRITTNLSNVNQWKKQSVLWVVAIGVARLRNRFVFMCNARIIKIIWCFWIILGLCFLWIICILTFAYSHDDDFNEQKPILDDTSMMMLNNRLKQQQQKEELNKNLIEVIGFDINDLYLYLYICKNSLAIYWLSRWFWYKFCLSHVRCRFWRDSIWCSISAFVRN